MTQITGMQCTACRIEVRGIVQGVGFRPFVYRTARGLGLSGSVRNRTGEVLIEVEGEAESLVVFTERLRRDAPPLARVEAVTTASLPPYRPVSEVICSSLGCFNGKIRASCEPRIHPRHRANDGPVSVRPRRGRRAHAENPRRPHEPERRLKPCMSARRWKSARTRIPDRR